MITIISFLLRKKQTHPFLAKSLIDTNANKKFNPRQDGIQIHSNYNPSGYVISFARLGDGENSWITDKCPTTTSFDRLYRPFITPAL